MDTQKQERMNSDNSDVQKQATVDTHRQERVVNSDNSDHHVREQGSFQAVVGTSGKVAHVGMTRHGAQVAKMH